MASKNITPLPSARTQDIPQVPVVLSLVSHQEELSLLTNIFHILTSYGSRDSNVTPATPAVHPLLITLLISDLSTANLLPYFLAVDLLIIGLLTVDLLTVKVFTLDLLTVV